MAIAREVGPVQLGHRLAQLRDRSGRKQAELARQIEWSQAVLSRVEAGERPVSDDELRALLQAIGSDEAAELAEAVSWQWQHLPRPALDHPDQRALWEAERVTATLHDLVEQPDLRPPFERRIDAYIKEIRDLADLLLRRDHQVAFVGSIGIGKSTAICRMTGLEVPSAQGRPAPVLETGGGGITLCEVTLHQGYRYGLTIEARPHDDIRVDVTEFAEQLRRSVTNTGGNQDEEALGAVPREIARAIRNMAGLIPKRTKTPDGKIVRYDPAIELAENAASTRELVVDILARMALHRRDRRDAWYEASDAVDEPLKWLKSMFELINNGRHPDFTLPSRIDLIVPSLIEVPDLDVSIIDTRGIDQPQGRADLEAHLEDPHTVVLLCSGFNDAPAHTIQHLLKRARAVDNPYINSNCSIVVLPRPDEALAVKDESGLGVDSTEEGYELKAEQVHGALTPYRLEQLPTGFFNALEDDPQTLRAFVVDRIQHTRSELRRRLADVIGNAQSLLDNAQQEQVEAVQRETARIVHSWMDQHQAPADADRQVHDALLSEIRIAHPSTIHASIRRNGEWSSLSYAHQLGYGARRIAVTTLADHVTGFTDLCTTLSGASPEASELLSQASRLMSQSYEELLRKMQLAGATLYRDSLQRDVQLWTDLASQWGRGPGYRERVADRNRTWFDENEHREVATEMVHVLNREWSTLLQHIASIFEDV